MHNETESRRSEQELRHRRDNSEREEPVSAIRRSEEQYRLLFESNPQAMWVYDLDTLGFLAVNEAAIREYGYSRDEFLSMTLREIRPEDDVPLLLEDVRHAPQGLQFSGEWRHRLRDGDVRNVRITSHPIDFLGKRARLVLVTDVTEWKRADAALRESERHSREQAGELANVNAELRRRTRDLEAALQARSHVYTRISHEIRTPITTIMLYNELLLGDASSSLSPEQQTWVTRSQDAAQHLLELVHDILDLSKIEAGKVMPQPAEVTFPKLLEDLFEGVRPLAESRGSELKIECAGHHCTVSTDPRRLRQVLLNLFSNAVKFGRARPITVRCGNAPGGGVMIEVIDQGIGIAPEDRESIFEDFVQLGESSEGGAGLGLAISRRLTDLLGGTLEVESVLGEGSTFRMTLPRTLPPQSPEESGEYAEIR